MQRFPIDPIVFPGGAVLLLPAGECIVRLDPLPDDAPDLVRDYFNRYTATLAALGHQIVVGDQAALALAAEAGMR